MLYWLIYFTDVLVLGKEVKELLVRILEEKIAIFFNFLCAVY